MTMMMTYPDGTRELYDAGLRVRVRDHQIVASDLTIQPQAPWKPIGLEPTRVEIANPLVPEREPEAFGLDVSVPSEGPGSQWLKQTHAKWLAQLEDGERPLVTESPDETMAVPRRLVKAS